MNVNVLKRHWRMEDGAERVQSQVFGKPHFQIQAFRVVTLLGSFGLGKAFFLRDEFTHKWLCTWKPSHTLQWKEPCHVLPWNRFSLIQQTLLTAWKQTNPTTGEVPAIPLVMDTRSSASPLCKPPCWREVLRVEDARIIWWHSLWLSSYGGKVCMLFGNLVVF